MNDHQCTYETGSNEGFVGQQEPTPSPLRAYQREGVRFLRQSSAALLADEMGLGKTVQVAVALRSGRLDYGRVLLVVPASLSLNWQRELETWAPELAVRRLAGSAEDRAFTYRLPIQVLIASYDQIRGDSHSLHGSAHFDLVIVDEAQRIKNKQSATSLACRIIPRDRSWALTGTPLENHPTDLSAIFRFLKPRLLDDHMSRSQMHDAMRPHFLRRTKAEVLKELPPIMSRTIHLELTGSQRLTYDDMWNMRGDLVRKGSSKGKTANMLALLTRLKQVCNFDDETGESVKLNVLQSILEETNRIAGKILIFSQYVTTLEKLSQQIGMSNAILHGQLTIEARDRVLHEFREASGPRALLLSIRAGGVGLNLQEASTVVLFDRWWNPALESQAIQRAHRYGREVPLEVVRFIVEDSVEERIQKILEDKTALFEAYVEEAPQYAPLRPEQLRQILELQ